MQAKQKEIEDAYRQAELSIARQAQFSFMPPPNFERGNLKIRVFQEQAADIGGDFYAYHEVGEAMPAGRGRAMRAGKEFLLRLSPRESVL